MTKLDIDIKKSEIQLYISIFLVVFGCTLLMMGFWVNPIGVISGGVLTAFGEIASLSAAIMGIDAVYKHKTQTFIRDSKIEDAD